MAAQSQIHPISCSVVTVCFCVWAKKHRTDVLKRPTNSQNLSTIFKPSSSCRVLKELLAATLPPATTGGTALLVFICKLSENVLKCSRLWLFI